MQAIFETLFDIVYLLTVIILGIRMIKGSRGIRQYQLFGMMAVVLGCGDAFHLIPRAVALCSRSFVHFRTGKLHFCPWRREAHHIHYHDSFLRASILCLAVPLSDYRTERPDCFGLDSGCSTHHTVHDAAECMDKHESAAFLGNSPEYSVPAAGSSDHRSVLEAYPGWAGSALPVSVADDRPQLRILCSGRPFC